MRARVCVGDGDGDGHIHWCFSQVKGSMDDDVAEGKFLSFVLSCGVKLRWLKCYTFHGIFFQRRLC